ncbi:sugar transferase [Vampirovibrio sp.]|uniref:sugar transferase n=1 Tax=Vampirovibrio sp. TaxID=2717857 RepID=UPI0035942C72
MSTETAYIPSQSTLDSSVALNVEATLSNRALSDPFFIAATYDISQIKPYQWMAKRCFDLLASSLGVVAILPLLLIVAAAIRLESPGPVIYKQTRVGLNGKTFHMYKFRSMRQDADKMLAELMEKNEIGQGMFKLFNDPRVTRIGKVIRKYSIDELPQLLNVLRGDMSLVGPRPPIQAELQHYQHWHYFRFATLPGLTGLWQVSGRSKIKEFDQVVKMDYQYINHWNLWLDFKLILKTFPVILGGRDTA